MKLLTTLSKALPRVHALACLLLTGTVLKAQDTATIANPAAADTPDQWYDQGWIWFVIIIVAIILVLAFSRRSGKDIGRDQNKFKERR
jgi:hypothetical protein